MGTQIVVMDSHWLQRLRSQSGGAAPLPGCVTGSDFSQMMVTLSIPFFSYLGNPHAMMCVHPCLTATAPGHHLHTDRPGRVGWMGGVQ